MQSFYASHIILRQLTFVSLGIYDHSLFSSLTTWPVRLPGAISQPLYSARPIQIVPHTVRDCQPEEKLSFLPDEPLFCCADASLSLAGSDCQVLSWVALLASVLPSQRAHSGGISLARGVSTALLTVVRGLIPLHTKLPKSLTLFSL